MKTLISCHANADWDALAAMIAAKLLHPEADLCFPGSQESGLNRFYNSLDKSAYSLLAPSETDFSQYGKLVIVDTRQAGRLKHVQELLEKKDLELEIWDHHPPTADDLSAKSLFQGRAGAVTSLLCAELQKRGITPSSQDATILGLGIYGDTGSFTYSSTTSEDFQAAAWLLGHGMDVNRINDTVCHELTGLHIHVLNSLLESAKTYMINNVPVVLAEAGVENYLGDFASLAHKLMEMEKFEVLFAIGVMGDRIQVVARSRNAAINVGAICSALGGGGHIYAASAAVRGKMINDVREEILRGLHKQAYPEKFACDYMSAPAIGLDMERSMRQADELMLHFGLKAIPVFYPGGRVCAGLLDAQTAARATAHGLGEEPVKEYMQRRVFTLPPGASLRELTEIIVDSRQRLVPIVENENVVGVVTRTDLINVFASDFGNLSRLSRKDRKPASAARMIEERLPAETVDLLRLAGNLGAKLGLPVYAVGGFARDLMLDHPNQDIDLVAEGNGIALARELARELGGRVREHEKFLTSVVVYHDKSGQERRIDVATARLEYYEYPAALPTVELSSIKMDLFRRDFSINALAIRLDGDNYGEIVDFFGGRRDIKDKVVRVLHTLSFVEDPTRCIRAVRFEQRYKFRIGPGTEKLIKNILPKHLLERLSPQRLFNEYKHLCEEESAAESLIRLDGLGILKALGKNLALNPAKTNILKKLRQVIAWYRMLFFEEKENAWISYYLALCHNLNYAEASENFRGLGLPEQKKTEILRQREIMRELMPKLQAWQKKQDKGAAKISALYELLLPVSLECLLYIMAITENEGLEKNLSRYITQWRRENADINGKDLRKLGLRPGPLYGEILKKALYAKLDGKAPTSKRQLALALAGLEKGLPER